VDSRASGPTQQPIPDRLADPLIILDFPIDWSLGQHSVDASAVDSGIVARVGAGLRRQGRQCSTEAGGVEREETTPGCPNCAEMHRIDIDFTYSCLTGVGRLMQKAAWVVGQIASPVPPAEPSLVRGSERRLSPFPGSHAACDKSLFYNEILTTGSRELCERNLDAAFPVCVPKLGPLHLNPDGGPSFVCPLAARSSAPGGGWHVHGSMTFAAKPATSS
jgi:hypothetical protein